VSCRVGTARGAGACPRCAGITWRHARR
jgi:hypothetical protein